MKPEQDLAILYVLANSHMSSARGIVIQRVRRERRLVSTRPPSHIDSCEGWIEYSRLWYETISLGLPPPLLHKVELRCLSCPYAEAQRESYLQESLIFLLQLL